MDQEKSNNFFSIITDPVVMSVVIIILIAVAIYFITNFIKNRNASLRRINMMTNIDDLTHLYKRKFFYSLFESELERAKRHERDLSCAIIEIDNFNELKDKYGDKFCDLVVQDIGEIFTDETRVHDICARYGDYSFASLMPESNINGAIILIKRLRGKVENTKFAMEDSNKTVKVTVSIGLVSSKEYFDKDINYKEVLEMADEALNLAKENGGNRVECYTSNKP